MNVTLVLSAHASRGGMTAAAARPKVTVRRRMAVMLVPNGPLL
jgi:hypothetical protein